MLFLIKLKHFLNIIKNFLTQKKYYCPYCLQQLYFSDLKINNTIRKSVLCPKCGSLERHRFAYEIYKDLFFNVSKKVKILHTAPEKCIATHLMSNSNIEYIPIDIEPSRYDYVNCLKEDVTELSFKDNSFDYIISNHVMEHIKDEQKFLSELLRVLKPSGKICLMFPIFIELDKTFEDDNIVSPGDRLKYYGQADHVRKYGKDVIDRLKKDYNAEVVYSADFENLKKYNACSYEYMFLITKN